MKHLLTIALAVLLLGGSLPSAAQAQISARPTITGVPVQQLAKDKTQIEFRLSAPETPYTVATEITFPFRVTKLIKVSSSYSATLGSLYPAQVVDNTIVIVPLDYGNEVVPPQIQAIPFDALSIFIETDQSMKEVKEALEATDVKAAVLSPNPADPFDPIYQELDLSSFFFFDGSLLLEAFTQYTNPRVLQFLNLGFKCYDQSPTKCLSELQNF